MRADFFEQNQQPEFIKQEQTEQSQTEQPQREQPQQPDVSELMRDLRQSFNEAFGGLRDELVSMVRDMQAAQPAPAETAKLTAKDKQDLASVRAAEAERTEQTKRFDELMEADAAKWTADDRAFVSAQALQQLREQQAAADGLPSEPEELRAGILAVLRGQQG
jgi:hypothetical protein